MPEECWEYLTEEEQAIVEKYGCFDCSDCVVPYRREYKMRCPKCGSFVHHLVTDIDGKTYYRCTSSNTAFGRLGKAVLRISRHEPCGTVVDNYGKVFTGFIAYVSDSKVKTLSVQGGQIV